MLISRVLILLVVAVGCIASTRAVADDAAAIKVVFYNLKNYLAMDRRVDGELVLNAPKPEREIEHLVAALKDLQPDVLAICEIGDPTYIEDFKNRLQEVGLDYPHHELVRAKSGHDRNLGLLSKYPIAEQNSRDDYTYQIHGERFPFQRGVLDVTLQVNPDYRLRCIVLHLKSKREVPDADQAEMRLSEAHLARKHLDEIFKSKPEENILVVGDLNDYQNEAPVKALKGYFGGRGYLSSLTLSDEYGFRWTHHWSYADSYSRFDYALVSRGITKEIDRKQSYIYHWDKWDDASDHRPIVIAVTPEDKEIKK